MKSCGKILYSQTGHRWQHGTWVLHAGYLRLQTHTQNMYTYCFSIATMAAQMHHNVTLRVHRTKQTELVLFSFSQMILFHSIMVEFVKSAKFPSCMHTYTHNWSTITEEVLRWSVFRNFPRKLLSGKSVFQESYNSVMQ